MAVELSNRELRELKARAQLLKPMLKVGKEGLSPAFLKAVDEVLAHHELVKVKFDEFKEQKKQLGPKLAQDLGARVVMQVGHVVGNGAMNTIFYTRTEPPSGVEIRTGLIRKSKIDLGKHKDYKPRDRFFRIEKSPERID